MRPTGGGVGGGPGRVCFVATFCLNCRQVLCVCLVGCLVLELSMWSVYCSMFFVFAFVHVRVCVFALQVFVFACVHVCVRFCHWKICACACVCLRRFACASRISVLFGTCFLCRIFCVLCQHVLLIISERERERARDNERERERERERESDITPHEHKRTRRVKQFENATRTCTCTHNIGERERERTTERDGE